MPNITIEGSVPLRGTVKISGSKHSAVGLIYAAMLSNDDVVLENVPHVQIVHDAINTVRSIGGTAEWAGANRLLLNGSTINTNELSKAVGAQQRASFLLAGPLLFRFGKARLPKLQNKTLILEPVNRLLETWRSLGVNIEESDDYYELTQRDLKGVPLGFKVSTHVGTSNAILSSVFVSGDTVISNASEESEIDDIISLLTLMGASVQRIEPRRIKVTGTEFFKGASFSVQPDKTEAATFAAATVLTKGDVIIQNIERTSMTAFMNFLSKIGAMFDFSGQELRIWRQEELLNSADVTISPTPGFVPDWQPLATLLLTQADGKSTVHDTVYMNRFEYIRDLNRMGARIRKSKPSEHGFRTTISDDSYDFDKLGEPLTVLSIDGPTKLKGARMHITDYRFEYALILAALVAEGKSYISDNLETDANFEKFLEKLQLLGAKIWN